MKKRVQRALVLLIFTGALCAGATAPAQTLFTNPIIVVSPMTLDFGTVPKGQTVTNTFLVENAGGGRLTGKASVPAPFKIIDGASYNLARTEAQVVTVTYRPSGAKTDKATVKFTGDGGAKAVVTGQQAGRGS